ncbi:MAG: hypothetical protein QHH19_00325 [Candidatus Thermoplasmatota archaeon]|nr:hypothetical protein [Candidatus Thermoplasmatota archaeon]
MSLVDLPLPSWTANITIIIFVLVFGTILIKKVMELLQKLLVSFNIAEDVTKNFTTFITALFWLFIVGIALQNLPTLFNPNIFPASFVGDLILRFVGYAFGLILPIVLLYVVMEIRNKK